MGVVITEKNLLVLESLAQYYVLTRKMIQEMCFPHVRSARSVCERLRKLKAEGYISQASMNVVLSGQSASPVYYPNKKTAETLAAIHDDDSFLNIYTKPPSTRLLFHWIEIARTHNIVDRAVEVSDLLRIPSWVNEWEVINKDVPNSKLHYTLHTVLRQEPPITCQPDAAFMVTCGELKKIFYVEVDRGTDSIRRIVSKKPSGYAMMVVQERFRKHFPKHDLSEAGFEGVSILFITTTKYRRNELARSSQKFEATDLWKFACVKDVTPETFFFEPIWQSHTSAAGPNSEGSPHPLIKV